MRLRGLRSPNLDLFCFFLGFLEEMEYLEDSSPVVTTQTMLYHVKVMICYSKLLGRRKITAI